MRSLCSSGLAWCAGRPRLAARRGVRDARRCVGFDARSRSRHPQSRAVSLALARGPQADIRRPGERRSGRRDRAPAARGGGRPARGKACRAGRRGTPAAGQVRDRPDEPRHPPRPLRRAREAAGVPGGGPHGRPDHRRLHGAGRGPERPRRHAPRALAPRRSTPTRRPTRSRRSRSSTPSGPRCASTASGCEWRARTCSTSCAGSPSPACSSARTSPADGGRRSRSRRSSCSIPSCRATTRSRSSADVELGGTDQKFNLLFARDVQEAYGQPPQSILTMPILPGTDGEAEDEQVATTTTIGVTDPPEEMFGKLMSIPDEVMADYYLLLLGEPLDADRHPAEAKRELARRLIDRFARRRRGGRRRAALRSGARAPRAARRRRRRPARGSRRRAGPPAGADRGRVRGLEQRGAAADPTGRRAPGRRRRAIPSSSTCRVEALAGRVLQVGKRRFTGASSPAPDDGASPARRAAARLLPSSPPRRAIAPCAGRLRPVILAGRA